MPIGRASRAQSAHAAGVHQRAQAGEYVRELVLKWGVMGSSVERSARRQGEWWGVDRPKRSHPLLEHLHTA